MRRRNFVVIGLAVVSLGFVWVAGSSAQEQASDQGEYVQLREAQLAYVLMNGSNTIAVIDLDGGTVVDRISVPGNPHGGAITPDGSLIYTASMDSEKIYVVETRNGRIVDVIDVGAISHHAAASPDGRYIYTAAGQVVVIDTASNRVIRRIETEDPPFYLEFAPDGRLLYALGMGSTISVIDPSTNETVDTIRMTATSIMGHLAYRPGGTELYVTNDADDMVSVVDLRNNRQVAGFAVGHGPHGIAFTADGRYAIVANRGGTTLSVIDADNRKIVATQEVGQRPEHVITGPDGHSVLVSVNTGTNKVLIIDPASFQTRAAIDVWAAPHAFLIARSARLQ